MSLENVSIVPLKEAVKRVKVGFVGSCNNDYCSSDEGVPMIRTTNLTKEGIKLENLKYINNTFHIAHEKSQLHFGDILIARHGHNGLASLWEYKFDAQCLNVVVVEPDESLANRYYLTYLINSPLIQKQIKSLTGGSVQSVVNTKDIADLLIPVPSLDKQKEIADFISLFNKKISICESINNNLFELSNIIHSDFIKSINNNNECSFIDLKELGNIVMGQSPKGDSYNYDNIGLPLINGAADYENGYLKAQKYTSEPKKTCDKNDLIFCIRATIGLLVVCDKKYCLGRGVAGITNIDPIYKEYAFHLIYSSIEAFKRAATGSVISGISRKDIENIVVKIPTENEIKRYHSIQNPIFDKLENNRVEITKLSKLRDTLLPKLMSGEIDVSKINYDLDNSS